MKISHEASILSKRRLRSPDERMLSLAESLISFYALCFLKFETPGEGHI
jgi:hypothetical protein